MSTERDLYECQAREESEYLGFYPFNKEDNDNLKYYWKSYH